MIICIHSRENFILSLRARRSRTRQSQTPKKLLQVKCGSLKRKLGDGLVQIHHPHPDKINQDEDATHIFFNELSFFRVHTENLVLYLQ